MLIYIDYDKTVISENEVSLFSITVEKIIHGITKVENNIPTYVSSYEISHNIYPIEIFIKISKKHVPNKNEMLQTLGSKFAIWKKENKFPHKININLIPMDWVFKLDV